MAKNTNSVILIGNIVRDLDEKSFGYIASGTARANVSIAVNRPRKDASGTWTDEVSYFDITIWGKQAENLKPYLSKGKKICVSGFLKQERWQGNDGQNHSRVVVVAEDVELLSPVQNGQNQAPQSQYQQQYNQKNTVPQNVQKVANAFNGQVVNNNGFPEDIPYQISTDDIPF